MLYLYYLDYYEYFIEKRINDFIGVGFVLHNVGSILGAGMNRFQGNYDVNCSETIPVRSAAKECGFTKLSMKSGCINVIRRFTHHVVEKSYLSFIVEDCCVLVCSLSL